MIWPWQWRARAQHLERELNATVLALESAESERDENASRCDRLARYNRDLIAELKTAIETAERADKLYQERDAQYAEILVVLGVGTYPLALVRNLCGRVSQLEEAARG